MKLGILKEIDWAYVGALFAAANENDQAAFLKGAAKEFMSWPTQYQREMQIWAANGHLTDDERELLRVFTLVREQKTTA